MSNKNLNPAELLNKVMTEAQHLSDQLIPPMPHFWVSDTGRFFCSVRVVVRNAKDLETMESLIQSFREPDEIQTTERPTMTFVDRVYGRYPEPQAEVQLVINIQ